MMRNIHLYISAAALLCLVSCSEIKFGDKFLGDRPESSGADIDTMFNSSVNAEKVLTKAYTYLPYGLPTDNAQSPRRAGDKLGVNVLEALTDLHHSYRANESDGPNNLYYNGALSSSVSSLYAGTEAYRFGQEYEYYAISYAWTFIENVGRVPDMTDGMKRQRAAEAKMIIAVAYSELLRYVGGVPLIDHSVDVNETFRYPRATFAETVDYIVSLLDDAATALPWKASYGDDGRMSKSGAMGLKCRVLLFAASPTFNSDTPWHPAADKYTCYGDYDRKRWGRAVKAYEDFFKELRTNGSVALVQPTEATDKARRAAFRSAYYDRGNSEILISTRRGTSAATLLKSFFAERNYSGPTLNYVNMFPWKDGSDFPENFNWNSPAKQPFFDADGKPTRDPRLYETVAVPGSIWYDGTTAPLHINHPKHGSPSTGFGQMKFILENSADRNGYIQWPYLRLSEIMLGYAEALNEYNGIPGTLACSYVNQVRQRVGLSDLKSGMSKEDFREAVLRERALELGFEEVRWFDLVRWGREQDFRKKLYGLESKGDSQTNPKSFTFNVIELNARAWANSWDTRWYLSPVPKTEIDMGYGMTQNPGW